MKFPDGETSESELIEIRHRVVGKEAPEIDTDYRGKVVPIDCWSEY